MYRIALAFCALLLILQPASAGKKRPTPRQNMELIKAPIERMTGLKMEPEVPDTPLCRDDKWCSGRIGEIRLSLFGLYVKLDTTTQEAPSTYLKACIGAFQGLSGSAPKFAQEIIPQAFKIASEQGEFERDIGGVEVAIRPGISSDLLACTFVRY